MKFRVTCSMIYRLAPFLPSSLPAPDPSSCLPPPPAPFSCLLSKAHLLPSHLLPRKSNERSEAGMCFCDPYSPTQKCAAGRGEKGAKLLTFFSDAPLRPPSPRPFLPLLPLSLSLSLPLPFSPLPSIILTRSRKSNQAGSVLDDS